MQRAIPDFRKLHPVYDYDANKEEDHGVNGALSLHGKEIHATIIAH